MKQHLSRPILFLLIALCCVACGKIEVPEKKQPNPEPPTTETDVEQLNSVFSVANALTLQPNVYQASVEGYIVGTIEGMSLDNCHFGIPQSGNTNILLADKPDETSSSKVFPIRLVKGGRFREPLNLHAHPELLGAQCRVSGLITTYFGVSGIREPLHMSLSEKPSDDNPTPPGGDTSPDSPVTPPQQPDSDKDPPQKPSTTNPRYKLPSFIAQMQPQQTPLLLWVEGYIVGYANRSIKKAFLTCPTKDTPNILLADTPEEKDVSKMVPVSLRSGSALRKAVNLGEHPENFHRRIAIRGQLTTYLSKYTNGFKFTDEWEWTSAPVSP